MSYLKKVVVIGSNSFSGSDFIDLLLEENRFQVIGISRSPEKSKLFLPYKNRPKKTLENFTFQQFDLNHHTQEIVAYLDELQPEYIVNFAAQSEVAPSWEFPSQWFQTNAVSLTNLIHSLKNRTYIKKYVHISSPEVYGNCKGIVTEMAPLNPSTPYAASKAAGDLSLLTFINHYNFPATIIRATNVYGAYQQLHKIIPRSAIYLKQNKKIELHGGGKAIKSYIHIRDVSKGELLAMEWGDNGEIYHLSPDSGIQIRLLVSKICELYDTPFEKVTKIVNERLGQDAAYIIDSRKARDQLEWKPKISIEMGLLDATSWINKNFNKIKKESLEYIHQP